MGSLPTNTVNGFAVDPSNGRVMYVALRDGVFRSDDAGASWTMARGGPKNVAAVAVNPQRPAELYAAATDGTMFVSRDAGKTWQPVR